MTNSTNAANFTNTTTSTGTNGSTAGRSGRSGRRMAVLLTAFAVSLGAISGCGATDASASNASSDSETSTAATASNSGALSENVSLYCRGIAGRSTAAPTEPTSAEFRSYWDARRQFESSARFAASGSSIADAWTVVENYTRNIATPLLADHSYEPSVLGDEPTDVSAARDEISRYELDACDRP